MRLTIASRSIKPRARTAAVPAAACVKSAATGEFFMLDDSDIALLSFWLMVLSASAGLTALFFYARDPRCLWRKRNTIEWTGKGFEPGIVATRVAQVRKDYAAALHPRRQSRFHAALLERAAGI